MMVLLQAMQGLGKPGVSIWGTTMGAPADFETWFPGYAEPQAACPTRPGPRTTSRQPRQAAAVPADGARRDPRPAGRVVGRRLLRPVAGAAVRALHLPDAEGYSEIKMLYRYGGSFMGTMTRHQQVGAHVPEPQARVRRQPGLLVVQRDRASPTSSCRPAPTSSATTSASGPPAAATPPTRTRATTTASSCARRSASSRSGSRSPTTRSWPPSAERLGLERRVHRRRQDRARLVRKSFYDCSDLAKTLDWEDVRREGLPHRQRSRRTTNRRRACAGSPRDAPATRRTSTTPSATPGEGARAGHVQRQDRVRVREPQVVRPGRRREAAGARATSRAGRATTPGAVREVPAAAHLAAPALLVPHPLRQAHRLAGRHPGPPHPEGRLLPGGRCASTRRTPPPAASATATSCSCTTTAARCSGCAVVTERVRPGVVHSYASSAKYDPLEPGKAELGRQGRLREPADAVADAQRRTHRA